MILEKICVQAPNAYFFKQKDVSKHLLIVFLTKICVQATNDCFFLTKRCVQTPNDCFI